MIKLSFIVPVYNVAPYLRKCVDSLLAQNYNDYEIILVDDGSTDGSSEICDEYAASPLSAIGTSPFSEADHSTIPIRVIHQANAGLSAARNTGIRAANGAYLCFVDSDDYWEENVLGSLMEQVERENLDVLRFDYQNVRVVGAKHLDAEHIDARRLEYEVFEPNKDPKRDVDYSESVVDGETFLNERLGPACYAVMFIFRRDLILPSCANKIDSFPLRVKSFARSNVQRTLVEQNGVGSLFTEGIYFEDVDWTPRMLLRAERVASTPMVVYNYLWRKGSITLPTNPAKRKKVLEDKIRLIRGFQEQSKSVQDPKWYTWMTSFIAMSVLGLLVKMPSIERAPYLQELKSLHIFPLSAKKEKMWTQRMKIFLANISPNMYCKLMSLRK